MYVKRKLQLAVWASAAISAVLMCVLCAQQGFNQISNPATLSTNPILFLLTLYLLIIHLLLLIAIPNLFL
jgi:hypothetical protein